MVFFFNPSACAAVVVGAGGVVKDADTGEVYDDLTLSDMRESNEWFEYDHDIRGCHCSYRTPVPGCTGE